MSAVTHEPAELFLEDGTPYGGSVHETTNGKLFGEVTKTCRSCGGSGRSNRGRRGCGACDGQGSKFDQALVYTAQQLTIRNAAADKRSQKKMAAEADRLDAIRERYDQFVSENHELMQRASQAMEVSFVQSVMESAKTWGGMTESQVHALRDLLDRRDREVEAFSGSLPVGEPGDELELELRCFSSCQRSVEAFQGRGMEMVNINEFVDRDGNAVTILHKTFSMKTGEVARISGVVRGGDVYRGWARTFLKKPVLLEMLADFTVRETMPARGL